MASTEYDPSTHHLRPPPDRLPMLPPMLAIAISSYIASHRDRFTFATLLRLPQTQAAALFYQTGVGANEPTFGSFSNVAVLDRFRRHLPRDLLAALFAECPMDYAASVAALQWWKDSSGRELRYTERALRTASQHARLDLLQWWRDSGLPLQYDDRPVVLASAHGALDVLQWWRDSGVEVRYNELAMTAASQFGLVDVLRWWKDCSGLPLKYDAAAAVYVASQAGLTDVLQWWKDSGLELRYDARAVDMASRCGRVECLQWWKDRGCELKYTSNAVKDAAGVGQIKSLRWWRDSGLEVDWAAARLETSSLATVLDWWEESGLFEEWLNSHDSKAVAFEKVILSLEFALQPNAVLEWWRDRYALFEATQR